MSSRTPKTRSHKRWLGDGTIRLRSVSADELAERGHTKVRTIDDRTGHIDMVTLPRPPWEQEHTS